jgi:hypothetical protein
MYGSQRFDLIHVLSVCRCLINFTLRYLGTSYQLLLVLRHSTGGALVGRVDYSGTPAPKGVHFLDFPLDLNIDCNFSYLAVVCF